MRSRLPRPHPAELRQRQISVPAGTAHTARHDKPRLRRVRSAKRMTPAVAVPEALFHADTEPVLQLVERSEAALVESLVPQARERLPGRLVIAADQARRPLHRLCLALPAHRRLPFTRPHTTHAATGAAGWAGPDGRHGRDLRPGR